MPDRIYSIQYNGRIYDVRAADNVNPNTLFAFVKQQAGGGGRGYIAHWQVCLARQCS